MSLLKKEDLFKEFGKNKKDSGSTESQIALFSSRIKLLSDHLKNNANIHKDMTFLVRQLSPTERGLPIEIYVFSNNTNWVEYEEIQSDIFAHLIAASSQFDLRIFQYPTGNDLNKPTH